MPQTPPASRATEAAKPQPPPPTPPSEFQESAIRTMDAPALIAILKDADSSEFQKAKACQRIGELGAKEAVPTLAALLASEQLSTYARYGLEPIDDPSVDAALREALSQLKTNLLLIGVINSIGKRQDAQAVPALARLLDHSDANVARAAAAALGSIGGMTSAQQLQAALGRTSGMTRMAIADGSLVCAERLLAKGQRDEALKLYAFLSAPGMPESQRLAAMQGIIREETRLGRPR